MKIVIKHSKIAFLYLLTTFIPPELLPAEEVSARELLAAEWAGGAFFLSAAQGVATDSAGCVAMGTHTEHPCSLQMMSD